MNAIDGCCRRGPARAASAYPRAVAKPETVSDAVRVLELEGYTASIRVDDGRLRCGSCGESHEPEALRVTHTYRFEGPTDPADEAIVLGIVCPRCGAKSVLVSAYGPDADLELLDLVARLG